MLEIAIEDQIYNRGFRDFAFIILEFYENEKIIIKISNIPK